MKEDIGNLWTYSADAIVITTNGFVKNNGEAVMGRGCAREAALKYPQLSTMLGRSLQTSGNRVFHYWLNEHVLTMPVKHHWREKADIDLIEKSAKQLILHADGWEWEKIVMPRPGCGNGQLNWKDVKPMLEEILDDRFVAITYEKTIS